MKAYNNINNTMVISMAKGKQTTELQLGVRMTSEDWKYFLANTNWKYLKSRKVFYLSAKGLTEEEFKMQYFIARKYFLADENRAAYDKRIKAIVKKLYPAEEKIEMPDMA